MLLGTGGFERGLVADVAARTGMVGINDATKALCIVLEEWPREAQGRYR